MRATGGSTVSEKQRSVHVWIERRVSSEWGGVRGIGWDCEKNERGRGVDGGVRRRLRGSGRVDARVGVLDVAKIGEFYSREGFESGGECGECGRSDRWDVYGAFKWERANVDEGVRRIGVVVYGPRDAVSILRREHRVAFRKIRRRRRDHDERVCNGVRISGFFGASWRDGGGYVWVRGDHGVRVDCSRFKFFRVRVGRHEHRIRSAQRGVSFVRGWSIDCFCDVF